MASGKLIKSVVFLIFFFLLISSFSLFFLYQYKEYSNSEIEQKSIILGQMIRNEYQSFFNDVENDIWFAYNSVKDGEEEDLKNSLQSVLRIYDELVISSELYLPPDKRILFESTNSRDSLKSTYISEEKIPAEKKLFFNYDSTIFSFSINWEKLNTFIMKNAPEEYIYLAGRLNNRIFFKDIEGTVYYNSVSDTTGYSFSMFQANINIGRIITLDVYPERSEVSLLKLPGFWIMIVSFSGMFLSIVFLFSVHKDILILEKGISDWKMYFLKTAKGVQNRIEFLLRYLERLSVFVSEKPEGREIYHNLGKEIDRIGLQTLQLKNFSNIEEKDPVLNFEQVDMRNLITSVTQIFEPQIEQYDAIVRLDIKSDIAQIRADKKAIMIVMTLLLENAIIYSAHQREIIISVTQDNNLVHVAVSDNGFGIPEQECSKVTQKFYRFIDEKRKNTMGVGMGLYLVKKIIEAHYGTLKIGSNEGEGTTVIISLTV